jgi:RNA polymerase sigma factor (TIGR02999 family)
MLALEIFEDAVQRCCVLDLRGGNGGMSGRYTIRARPTLRIQASDPMTTSLEVSQLLRAWSNGETSAADRLMPLVYEELRHIARRQMRRQRAGHTLQTTALIHEAYVRLVGESDVHWQNRAHFFGVAAKAMRHILVDHARSRHAAKRGGAAQRVTLDEAAVISAQPAELVALDDALRSLAGLDPRKGQVVELKYFGGLTVDEIAKVLRVSPETVARDWRLARAWLLRELSKDRQPARE